MTSIQKNHLSQWLRAAFHAAPVILLVSGLFYYWFVAVDRFVVFLYGHLGATPFDPQTASRYWMAGLVASGAVMVLYTAVSLIAGLVSRHSYAPPLWWQLWLLSALPLAIVIPAIVMRLNTPTLPLKTAVFTTIATIVSLAIAFMPARMAAQSPIQFAWLAAAGMGLIPSLLLLRAVELPSKGLIAAPIAYSVAIISTIAGAMWMLLIAWLYAKKYKASWQVHTLFIAGLCWSYLLLPLVHHLLFTPRAYRYISSSSNFFAEHLILQATTAVVAIFICIGATSIQRKVCNEAK